MTKLPSTPREAEAPPASDRPAGLNAVRRRLTDSSQEDSFAARARKRRWELLAERFPDVGEMRVLDLGGTADSWLHSGLRPGEVVLLNVQPSADADVPWLRALQGDACSPPAAVREERFDLVYSNSVIDQVGGHERRTRFAETVHSLAPHHWVQTAYRYFPLDAYFLIPGFAWLPLAARAALANRWRLGPLSNPDRRSALESALGVELLTGAHMRHYFPGSDLLRERILGLTKSLIAAR